MRVRKDILERKNTHTQMVLYTDQGVLGRVTTRLFPTLSFLFRRCLFLNYTQRAQGSGCQRYLFSALIPEQVTHQGHLS